MKVFILIMTAFLVQVSAYTNAQVFTMKEDNISLKRIFTSIRKQTGYTILYESALINKAKNVNVNFRQLPLEDVLKEILKGQNLEYEIKRKAIIITEKMPSFLDKVVDAFTPPIDIRGMVLDEKGQPLPGVTVRVKGFNKATSTGNDGRFYLPGVDDDAVLEFRMVGYKVLELPAKGKFEGLKMEQVSNDLDETIVVAYGKTTRQALTGAITVIKGDQIADLPNRSFDKSLQGLVPGLQITNGTGQPGGGVSNMVLRGISTGTDAYAGSTLRNPLIVIDGIPVTQDYFHSNTNALYATPISNPLAQLNASDIETISVLKDAAAIALYGSKASNGVILVTTKKGKEGKTIFNFRSQTDLSYRPKDKIEVLNQQEYLGQLFEAYRNTNPTLWTDNAIRKDLYAKFPYRVNGADTSFYPMPNWNKELYNNRAETFSNELSMSGGSQKSSFYLNLEYTKQNGIAKKTGYDRKSARFNFENRPASWIKAGINSTFSYNNQDFSNPNEDAAGIGLATIISPLNPVRLSDGSYQLNYSWGIPVLSVQQMPNPIAANEYNINRLTAYRGLGKLYADLTFLKNFTLSSSLGVDFLSAESKRKQDPRLRNTSFIGNGSITDYYRHRTTLVTTNLINYNQQFGRHNLSAMLGQEAQILAEKGLGIEVRGTATTSYYYEEINNPGYTFNSFSNLKKRQTLLSQFSRLEYNFKSKYYLSASARRDGSSLFGDQEQWGTYWSAGAGWVLTEETFMKSLNNWISYAKLRGSIGAAGNSGAVGESTRYNLLTVRTFQKNTALFPSDPPGNPFIRWEETFSWDAGFEARFLKDRLSFTADVYRKYTSDLIYSINLSSYTGSKFVNVNIGDMSNRGVELAATAKLIKTNNFQWQLNANWSTNKNLLVKANVPLTAVFNGLLANEEGRNFNSFYLPVWMGVNQADGKPQWRGTDGNPTSNYSLAQKSFVGKPQPNGFGAITQTFSFKGFEASVQFYYQYGSMIFDENSRFRLSDGAFPYLNQLKQSLDHWRAPGDIAANPRILLDNTDRGNEPSTRQLFDADYIRLQSAGIGYNFPKSIIRKWNLNLVKVYLQGNNLALWSKFPGMDPDNMNTGGGIASAFPIARTFTAGINVQF